MVRVTKQVTHNDRDLQVCSALLKAPDTVHRGACVPGSFSADSLPPVSLGPWTLNPVLFVSLSQRQRVAHFMTSRSRFPPVSPHQTGVAWSQHSQPPVLEPQFPHLKMDTAPLCISRREHRAEGQRESLWHMPGMQVALNACSILFLSQAQACPGSPTATGSKAFGIPGPPSQRSLISAWHTEGTQ